MSSVIDDLRQDHANIAKLLDTLEDQVRLFEAGEVPDYDLLERIVDYFLDYPASVHHPKEDLVLAKLRARDPVGAEAVGDLGAEHEEIAVETRRFAATLEELLQEAEMPRDAFPRAVRDFVDREREHMNMEDSRFLPVAEQALTQADWDDVAQEFQEQEDPVFGRLAQERFATLREYLSL
ncbi:MAG: hemerythrin domain-containing protein [Alphaproteobacteria bacterium]|nr:hemerythrin domain-containing protein [Alphaproteobacteria bacterium]